MCECFYGFVCQLLSDIDHYVECCRAFHWTIFCLFFMEMVMLEEGKVESLSRSEKYCIKNRLKENV